MKTSKLIYGIGVNDADYIVKPVIGGVRSYCPYYKVWIGVLERCYSEKCQKKHPTYKGCKICPEWHSFMVFQSWMKAQDWENKELDKDILGDGKLYSPNTCCFVEKWLNNLFNDCRATRGKYPIGVTYQKSCKRYRSQININGVKQYLGVFKSPEEAHEVYLQAKRNYVIEKMKDYPNKHIKQVVLNKVNKPCECEWCIN